MFKNFSVNKIIIFIDHHRMRRRQTKDDEEYLLTTHRPIPSGEESVQQKQVKFILSFEIDEKGPLGPHPYNYSCETTCFKLKNAIS